MLKKEKVEHDYTCDVCGKPATVNVQNWWHKYSIDNKGEMIEINDWKGDENNFYCDKHDEY